MGKTLTGRDGVTLATLHGSSPTQALSAQVVDNLVSDNLVSAVRMVAVRAADPALESCDMKLADAPEAQPYIAVAEQAAIANGWATPDAFANTASPFLVTDDPFDASAVLVLLDVPGPPVSDNPAGGPGIVYQQRTIAVLLDRSSRSVLSSAQGSW